MDWFHVFLVVLGLILFFGSIFLVLSLPASILLSVGVMIGFVAGFMLVGMGLNGW